MRKTTVAALASALVIAPITAATAQDVVADPAGTTVPTDDVDNDDDDSGKWGLLGLLGLAGLLGLKRRDRDDDTRRRDTSTTNR